MSPGCSKAQGLLILAVGQFFTQAYMKFPHFEEIKPIAVQDPIQHYLSLQLSMLSVSKTIPETLL